MTKSWRSIQIFDKATLKLTIIYTAYVMVVTLIFSAVVGAITICEIRKPARMPIIFQQLRVDEDYQSAYKRRAASLEATVWSGLIMVNISTLIISALASYQLAKSTLKPIKKAMEDEAQFVSDASHELRTPLATMRMENEILLRDKNVTNKELRSQIRSNIDEIDKLRAMTDALLKMCSSQELEVKKQDVAPIIDQAINRVAKSVEAKKISINNEVREFNAICNEDALSEIIYIYLDNAVKYSPENSNIYIRQQGSNSLSVTDEGSGIAKKDMGCIFNRFYRADESRNSDGFGLGLSLASRLSDQIGAKLSAVNNDSGVGATFIITFRKS